MKNIDNLKRMLEVFGNCGEGDKMKYYDMIIEFAENYDRNYFTPYINAYKSPKSEVPTVEYINNNIPLLIYFAFYKAFTDSTINVKLYFEAMSRRAIKDLKDYNIIPFLYYFLIDEYNVEKCRFTGTNNPFLKTSPYNNGEFIYQNKSMKNYLELMTSILSLSLAADSSSSDSDKPNNEKILLSTDEMEDVYLTILYYCRFRDKIDRYEIYHRYMDKINKFGLRSILEDLLNTPHLSIIHSVEKLKRESYLDKLADMIFGCAKSERDIICLECAFLDIMRKLQNKYIYNNTLLSIHQICKKYIDSFQNQIFNDCYEYLTGDNIADGNFLYNIKERYVVIRIGKVNDMIKDCFVEF
jgi:hypothetical protein